MNKTKILQHYLPIAQKHIQEIIFAVFALWWFVYCFASLYAHNDIDTTVSVYLIGFFSFLFLLVLGLWFFRNIIQFCNYVFAIHPKIQEKFQGSFRRWGLIVCIFYVLLGGTDVLGKAYFTYEPEVTKQIKQGANDPQEAVTKGISYVLVTYVGAILRSAYNILRAISAHVAQDYVEGMQLIETNLGPTPGDKIRNIQTYNYSHTLLGRGWNWTVNKFAGFADDVSGSTAVEQAVKVQTSIAKQYGEVIAMAFVTGSLYKFWGFFKWLYSMTVFLALHIFTFFFGSSSMIGKAFIGKSAGLFGSIFKGLLILLGLHKEKDITKGSAHFSDRAWEKVQVHKKNKGLLIDGKRSLTERMSDRHLCVIAPSGQGKTSNYVIPNLLKTEGKSIEDNPSYIVTDPKGEIWRNTSGYLASLGYSIQVINLMDVYQSHTFNPLLRANSDTEIGKAAEMIIDARFQGGGKQNTFFLNTSKMLLTLLIKIIKHHPDQKYHTLYNLFQMVSIMGARGEGLVPFVVKYVGESSLITREYMSYLSKDAETISNVILTVQTALKDLAIQDIRTLTSTDTIQLEHLRGETPTAIYLITPPSDIEFFRFFLTMFYQQIFTYCEKSVEGFSKEAMKKTRRVVFLMDEFGNLGRIPSFPIIITTLRSAKCSVSIILQDIEQVRIVYGKSGASAILNGGCSTKLIFGGIQNMETLSDVSRLLGNKTIEQTDENGRKLPSIGRALMTPDELNRMQLGEAILLSSGFPPIQLKLTEWESNVILDYRGKRYRPINEVQEIENPIPILKVAGEKYQKTMDKIADVISEEDDE